MLFAMAVLEGDVRQVEPAAARGQVLHHRVALRVAHAAPQRDLFQGAAAADARVALGVHDADLHAGRLHAFADSALLTLEEGSRPSTPQIHCPMPTSLPRSTPVSTPRPCSMYTTSSVATLPEAPLAYGQPPRPAMDESKVRTPTSNDA